MKKVLFISARSDIGGGPKHLVDLVTRLKYAGVKAWVAAPLEEPYGPQMEKLAEGFVHLPKRAFNPWHFFKLLALISKEEIQIVHSHGRGAGLYGRLLGLFNIKVVHTFHGAHAENSFIGKIKVLMDRILAPLTDRYICVSKDEREKVLEYGFAEREKISVVDNGINIEQTQTLFSASGISVAREAFQIGNEDVVLGTLARLHYQKGLDLLMNHLGEWKSKNNSIPFKFYIAGDGPEETELKQKASKLGLNDSLIFIGSTLEPMKFLRTLDIYVSTARWEGLPISVLEAMACPLPCFLSDITGHKTLAKNGGAQLFDLENFQDFETKLKSILGDIRRQGELKEKALNTIVLNHSDVKMADETLKVYEL